jgi:hypothetical protein
MGWVVVVVIVVGIVGSSFVIGMSDYCCVREKC